MDIRLGSAHLGVFNRKRYVQPTGSDTHEIVGDICLDFYWAFDHGLFTISPKYELIVHEEAKSADHALFPILEANGKPILLPSEPDSEALESASKGTIWRVSER